MTRSPQIRIVCLLLLLIGVVAAACWAYVRTSYLGVVLLSVSAVIICLRICYWHRSVIRMFIRMLEDVKYRDHTLHFSTEGKIGLEKKLSETMNEVLEKVKKTAMNQADQLNYYETLLNMIDSCLIVVGKDGKIHWMNQEAIQELCGHALHHIDELRQIHEDFPGLIQRLKPGHLEALRIYRKDIAIDMAVTITEYQRRGSRFKLVHLRNIRSLLEDNEMEAWQKLVRVLTHEIMNSIAPIISLSDTLNDYTQSEEWTEEHLPVIRQGLQTILRRSKGLLDFVENYRKLTRISTPVPAPVRVGDFLLDIRKLLNNCPVDFQVENENLVVMMDRTQMEQVLLNLIKNAQEACSGVENPRIEVSSVYEKESRLWVLTVSDNGCGILPEVTDKIFVPFFTTKPAGSGIGLSLCKQVVNLHGGHLSVKSEVDRGTSFVVKLLC